ncbi:AraC family transcriptional regulator [Cupriavidus necator]|uniref:helix-turn-helix transcriptional regulator n=1 Tax=Cupriavidus necator TaxID=106590 RepID=UPI003ECEBDA9
MEHFSFSGLRSPSSEWSSTFSAVTFENSKRYYTGEGTLLDEGQSPHLDVTMVLGVPYPMGKVSSRSRYVYRRGWDHIRDNKENVLTLWYIKRGSMTLSQMGNTCELKAGDFAFTRSNSPMRYENIPCNYEAAEWLFIVFPLEVMHQYFPHGVPVCTGINISNERQAAMPMLISMLCEVAESLNREVTDALIGALLKEAALLTEQQGAQVERRQSIGEKRIEDITSYISLHLANPEISLSMVAQGCKISPRYLCHLLRENNTTFSQLLWTGRLNEAKKWLLRLDKRHYGINEIAYMTGYKSVAHFSRMFRERFGCSPREFRRREGCAEVLEQEENHKRAAA